MMKKLVTLSLLTIVMSLASCSHMGCNKSGSQCSMKKESCGDCKGKEGHQCAMKKEGTEEVKK